MAKIFKTNLQCGGCVATAKPFLDKAIGSDQWSVDLTHEDRLLTVEDEQLKSTTVKAALDQAGFAGELVE